MRLSHWKLRSFNGVDLTVILATLAITLAVAIPNFRSIKREGALVKAEEDLAKLKTALKSYWQSNHQNYPNNIHAAIVSAIPLVVAEPLRDPWRTDKANLTYGYMANSDPSFGNYFIIYTKGPEGDTKPVFNPMKQRVEYSGGGKVVSNVPLLKH